LPQSEHVASLTAPDAVLNDPRGHLEHAAAELSRSAVLYVPAAHCWHQSALELAAAVLYRPAPHAVHDDCAATLSSVPYDPVAQSVHCVLDVRPVPVPYLPLAHDVQAASLPTLVPLKVPSGHSRHTLAVCPDHSPAEHSSQAATDAPPSEGLYVPAAQSEHVSLTVAVGWAYLPFSQLPQSDSACMPIPVLYLPALQ